MLKINVLHVIPEPALKPHLDLQNVNVELHSPELQITAYQTTAK
jgi:hypothetical protein